MQSSSTPVIKDLVLVGGGHSHVIVLKKLGMKPVPGLRVTLITRDIHTPYSGMLPGYVAGLYDYDQCHIDLGPLARFAGARLYHNEVEGLDLENQLVLAGDRPPVHYDLLSINTGSRPATIDVPGALEHALVAKPINIFLQRWEKLVQKVKDSSGPFRIVVVGGGAGGVELALSSQYRLRNVLESAEDNPERLEFKLISKADRVLSSHNEGVTQKFETVLQQRGIEVIAGTSVTSVTEDSVLLENGQRLATDAVIWVTSASTPDWPEKAGLAVDETGFIRVNEFLQSTSHNNVFVAGDVASMPDPRPKSGVFAVRQGPVLTDNLLRTATGGQLQAYKPQKLFLGLISTGNRNAVASRGNWSLQGRFLWRWKDWIDRRFMQAFNELPEMNNPAAEKPAAGLADEAALAIISSAAMRCGGCGAKVGATVLNNVMKRLPLNQREDVLIGRDAADDCAMLSVPHGKVMVQSVDYFRAFIDDAYTFGAIAANHALGDLYAMGAEPQSALAIATVPYGSEKIVEESLFELMSGALKVINASGAVLAGGHSSEGVELAFGLTVNGLVYPEKVLRKSGLKAGDVLILTKPVGTGTLMAADMRHQAKGRWVSAAIESMLVSNQQGAAILQAHYATACTDLTGFGLIGHLIEMLRASDVNIALSLDNLPVLDGALETVAAGIVSSLQPQNLRLRRAIKNIETAGSHPLYPLLFDPQTAGGLLAGIPADQAQACLEALKKAGYADASIIGECTTQEDSEQPIVLSDSP